MAYTIVLVYSIQLVTIRQAAFAEQFRAEFRKSGLFALSTLEILFLV